MGTFDRRNFIFKTTGLAASASLLGISTYANSNNPLNFKPYCNSNALLVRKLGKTDISVPIISMGVMNANNPNLLKEAFKQGIRHFDTAWYYQQGNNERMVGQVIRELGVDRSEVVIATKIFLHDVFNKNLSGKELKDNFLSRFNESLDRLQMDYVDILYYHNVVNMDMIRDPYIIEAFKELKEKKQIRYSGVSIHVDWPELLNATANDGFYDIALLSYNYSMAGLQSCIDAMQNAVSKGMGLIAMKTQCQQGWYKQALPAEAQKFYEGKIMHSALLKWVMNHDYFTTAIPGFTTYQQLEEDMVVATNLKFNEEEKKFIEDHNVKIALQGVCQICGKCRGTCPQNVNIPELMRTHMYAYAYGNVQKATETIKLISKINGINICSGCDTCVAKCVRSVNISHRINELKEIYC